MGEVFSYAEGTHCVVGVIGSGHWGRDKVRKVWFKEIDVGRLGCKIVETLAATLAKQTSDD